MGPVDRGPAPLIFPPPLFPLFFVFSFPLTSFFFPLSYLPVWFFLGKNPFWRCPCKKTHAFTSLKKILKNDTLNVGYILETFRWRPDDAFFFREPVFWFSCRSDIWSQMSKKKTDSIMGKRKKAGDKEQHSFFAFSGRSKTPRFFSSRRRRQPFFRNIQTKEKYDHHSVVDTVCAPACRVAADFFFCSFFLSGSILLARQRRMASGTKGATQTAESSRVQEKRVYLYAVEHDPGVPVYWTIVDLSETHSLFTQGDTLEQLHERVLDCADSAGFGDCAFEQGDVTVVFE